jgi:hypothetical protein
MPEQVIIFELKSATMDDDLGVLAQKALQQIKATRYGADLRYPLFPSGNNGSMQTDSLTAKAEHLTSHRSARFKTISLGKPIVAIGLAFRGKDCAAAGELRD